MGKYIMVAQSNAKDGRDAEFNEWYDTIHLKEICSVPGIVSGKRFKTIPAPTGAPALPYIAIYEFEADDPNAVIGELMQRAAGGKMTMSDALDSQSATLFFYKAQ